MLLPSLDTLQFRRSAKLQEDETAEFKSYLGWRIEQGAPIKYVESYPSQHYFGEFDKLGGFGRELESRYHVQVNIRSLLEQY